MEEQVRAATMCYHELGDSIKAAEARMAEIAVMKTHIINYTKTRSIYEAYRKAGYSKRFLEANRESIALHKAAKAAFDEAGLKKLPKVKELSIEYVELLKKKKAEYPSYRKARERMQELMKAQKNVEMFLQTTGANYVGDLERGVKTPSLDAFIRIVEALDVPADTLIRDTAAPASYVADDELNRKLSRLTPGQKKAATDILNAYIDNIPYIKEK